MSLPDTYRLLYDLPADPGQSDLVPVVVTLADLLKGDSMCARLARYFMERRGAWIDGRDLQEVGGVYAWRSRVSDLRKAPWHLDIQNLQRQETAECPICDGDGYGTSLSMNCARCHGRGKVTFTRSLYRLA